MSGPAPAELNILFITADQLRADVLHGRLAGIAPTPNLDRLARQSVVFENHVTVTAPCGPARASLLTGLYASNHGSLRNGTPLDAGLTNLAKEWRKAGREPLLFGYTDATPDPDAHHPADPTLASYEGLLPGFREVVEMRFESPHTWLAHLIAKGYDLPRPLPQRLFELYLPQGGAITGPALYRAEDSDTALLTDLTIAHLDARRDHPWTAHLTYIRPHPPFVAPAPWNAAVDPSAIPLPGEARADHPFTRAWFSERNSFGLWMGFNGDCEGLEPARAQELRAVYLGLVAELDHHIGRLLDWLEATGQAERTVVVFTGDHGEMLGDGRMWGKHSVFEKAFHVPLMIRDPSRARHARPPRDRSDRERRPRPHPPVARRPRAARPLGRPPPDALAGGRDPGLADLRPDGDRLRRAAHRLRPPRDPLPARLGHGAGGQRRRDPARGPLAPGPLRRRKPAAAALRHGSGPRRNHQPRPPDARPGGAPDRDPASPPPRPRRPRQGASGRGGLRADPPILPGETPDPGALQAARRRPGLDPGPPPPGATGGIEDQSAMSFSEASALPATQ